MTRFIEGADALIRRFNAIPVSVRTAAQAALEQSAAEMVVMMRQFAPEPMKDKIHWTLGDAPAGSVVLIRAGARTRGSLRVTVYVNDYRAHWFEFGTAERVQKKTGRRTGRMTPSPFFWPSYRALRRRVRSRMSRAVNKAIRELGMR